MKLTKTTIQRLALPVGVRDRIFFDDTLAGFGLRLREGGRKSWVAQYRIGAKQRRITIGTVATLEAEEARKQAKSILSRVHLGGDPQLDKVEVRAQASNTLLMVVNRYIEERARRRLKVRSLEEVERHLRKHWAPLAELPIKKVTRTVIAMRLGTIARENGPYAANRARAALSALFSWAVGEGLADINPVIGTNRATKEIARERVLLPDELLQVWNLAGEGD